MIASSTNPNERLLAGAGRIAAGTGTSPVLLARIIENEIAENTETLQAMSDAANTPLESNSVREVAIRFASQAADEVFESVDGTVEYDAITIMVEEGEFADEVVRVAAERGYNHVYVAGRQCSPTGKALFGDTAQRVVLNFDRPVTILTEWRSIRTPRNNSYLRPWFVICYHIYQLSEQTEPIPSGSSWAINIGYIGNGSQGWAHTLINDLTQYPDLAGGVTLYDMDYGVASRNALLGSHTMDREKAAGDWSFEATRSIDRTLDGADFVICSVQDPPGEAFAHDIDVSQEYDIYQTVTGTVGPGGTIRALRATPQYRDIAATVYEHCPDAWVISYTNPVTVCTRTLYEEFPDINTIRPCHEVFKTQGLFAGMVERYIDEAEGVAHDRTRVNVRGISHFAWVSEMRWRDRDVFQYLNEELGRRRPLFSRESGDLDAESYWMNNEEATLDPYDRFGVLGAAGNRHLAGFVPWYLSIDEPAEIQRYDIRLTPSSARISDNEGPDEMECYLEGDAAFGFHESGEEAVDIMWAPSGEETFVTHLSYPNEGQADGLPESVVVETNALPSGDDVVPLCTGGLPDEIESMVQTRITDWKTLVHTGFKGDLDLAFQAFLSEPLVTVSRDKAQELFVKPVELEQEYFTDYDLDASVLQV